MKQQNYNCRTSTFWDLWHLAGNGNWFKAKEITPKMLLLGEKTKSKSK